MLANIISRITFVVYRMYIFYKIFCNRNIFLREKVHIKNLGVIYLCSECKRSIQCSVRCILESQVLSYIENDIAIRNIYVQISIY